MPKPPVIWSSFITTDPQEWDQHALPGYPSDGTIAEDLASGINKFFTDEMKQFAEGIAWKSNMIAKTGNVAMIEEIWSQRCPIFSRICSFGKQETVLAQFAAEMITEASRAHGHQDPQGVWWIPIADSVNITIRPATKNDVGKTPAI